MTPTSEDVVLFYSRHCGGSVEWAKYLHKLYTELSRRKGRLRVRHLPLEDIGALESLPPHIEEEIYNSRLQLVLVSPVLLQFIHRHPKLIIGGLLHPDRVIAIMLGVKDDLISLEHKSVFATFPQWIHLEAKDHDLEFVQTVLYFSTQILQRSCTNKAKKLSKSRSCVSAPAVQESTVFNVHPKVLTEGQNKAMLIMESPQSSKSDFRVALEGVQCSVNVSFVNPFNLSVVLPSGCFYESQWTRLRLYIDGNDCGYRSFKIESSMGQIESLLKVTNDPVDFMCQSLRIGSKPMLDDHLSKQFLERVPKSGFPALLSTAGSHHLCSKDTINAYPTLLHFAAHHGLNKLAKILTECPGAAAAATLRNRSDKTPVDIAENCGNFELADLFRKLTMQHHEPPQVPPELHKYDYIRQSEYQVPPPPRPVPRPVLASAAVDTAEDNDDVFLLDRFGTMRASDAIAARKKMEDYRKTEGGDRSLNDELRITDDLLNLLDDFRNNPYSAKEMETKFDEWRRKAAGSNCNLQLGTKKSKDKLNTSYDVTTLSSKASTALAKLFHKKDDNCQLQNLLNIRPTDKTRSFRKPAKSEPDDESEIKPTVIAPPPPGNETIVEGEILDEGEMSVVVLPPTPNKVSEDEAEDYEKVGVSTQILPLTRLSLSSSASTSTLTKASPASVYNSTMVVPDNTLSTSVGGNTTVTELTTTTTKRTSPVRDKLDKLKKSLTEPLMQYFHVSPECEEEPELLNTPKSLNPAAGGDSCQQLSSEQLSECDSGKGVSPRQLVFSDEMENAESLPTPPPTPPSTKPLETDM